jgi:NitT/TauT family transport system substrate-binding protein
MARQRFLLPAAFIVLAATTIACGSSGDSTSATTAASSSSSGTGGTGDSATPAAEQVTTAGIPAARCAANKEAGKITYLSGFDFSASASIVDVIVAKDKGYYDKMCLNVELKPSFSTANYPLIAADEAQVASGGSYTEVLQFAANNNAKFIVLAVEGKTAIDTLMIKEGQGTKLADLKGKTIGVKGKIPPSIDAMLAQAGLVEGKDYKTVGLEGFDPTVQMKLPGIAGLPGYKSNEPGQLERAKIPFTQFDPTQAGIPGSFGVIYTNPKFVADHPTAAQDFMRATMKGLADAMADPAAAAMDAVALINSHGNPNFLSPVGEQFRWITESGLVKQFTPADQAPGEIDPKQLQAEVDAYAEIGIFTKTPAVEGTYDQDLIGGVYDARGAVIWPQS